MTKYACLKDRRILITGGGRGFGRAMALAFVKAGARVMVTSGRNADELAQTLAEAAAIRPDRCVGYISDVSNEADCQHIAQRAQNLWGGIDVLFNNAARGPSEAMSRFDRESPSKFWEADSDGYHHLVSTNIVGPYLMTKAVIGSMIEQGFGRIINMLTSGPTMAVSGRGPYGASKAALEASTVIWARDVEGSGVTVNGLLPGGASDTALIPGDNIGQRAIPNFRAGKNSESEGRVAGLLPVDVIVEPALWLASDQSSSWNGRRFVGKNWDVDLESDFAAQNSVTPKNSVPLIL